MCVKHERPSMNDMTPFTARLTADRAKTMLEEAGAQNVRVVNKVTGRGRVTLAFFVAGRKQRAWVVHGWIETRTFQQEIDRGLTAQ